MTQPKKKIQRKSRTYRIVSTFGTLVGEEVVVPSLGYKEAQSYFDKAEKEWKKIYPSVRRSRSSMTGSKVGWSITIAIKENPREYRNVQEQAT